MAQDYITAPTLPTSPRYGLVPSARVITDGSDTESQDGRDVRWIEGFGWRPEDCRGGGIIDPCDFSTPTQSDPEDEKAEIRYYRPVVLEAAVACSTFGSIDPEERARARRKLMANTSRLLETELWAGAGGTAAGYTENDFLASTETTNLVHGGTAVGYQTALAELEQRLADTLSSQDRMIHAMPRVVTHWIANGLVKRDGNLLRTELGTVVVPGAGYLGTSPAGAAPAADQDRSWAYATDAVVVRLGQLFDFTADEVARVNRASNRRLARVGRFAAATFDCAVSGALVDLTTDKTTTGS